MYRSTIELDDEDTINEHRRYLVAKPDHAREKAIRFKMRATINIMNATASKILNTETRICKDEKAVQIRAWLFKINCRYVASSNEDDI